MAAAGDDEFVFTLSDHEDNPSETDVEIPTKLAKRKRSEPKPSKSKKRQKIAALEEPAVSDDSGEDFGVKDDALDSDFEFDLGTNAENLEDFDAWGGPTNKPQQQEKDEIGLESVLARHMKKRNVQQMVAGGTTSAPDPSHSEDEGPSEGDDSNSDNDLASLQFDDEDDELLADDNFGADAASEDGGSAEGALPEDDNSDDESDSGSVASPTAHPDDLASDDHSDAESQTSISDDPQEKAKREAFFAPEDRPATTNQNKSDQSFQQFSLSRPILRGLAALNFTTPTPIQVRAIPIALQGIDVVGSAVTGSGKTAAFLLPILERLLYRSRKVATTRVAILMPTRELAVQCYNVATALARFTDITFAQVVGGFSLREQESILKKRPDVVIATPGRFIDHMRNSVFAVEHIEILVLDEADRMLETGFEDELAEILKTIPKGRQTMLFSATMTDSVDKLVRVGMNRPVRLSVDAKKSTTAGLTQEFVRLRQGKEDRRLATLCILCKEFFTERTIIFFRQKKEAHRVRIIFALLGLQAGELHGSMSQDQRINAVNSFRDGKTTHLLATDLASRGLDIKNVATVVNYEAPQTHEIYLHRVGRTARAGKSGRACTIAAEPDRKVVKAAVKAARSQSGAKIVSRVMNIDAVDAMFKTLQDMEPELDEILKEEKEEKQLATTLSEIQRGENLIKHEEEIKSRPKRTWFESEKDKREAKTKGQVELNGPDGKVLKVKSEKRKLSNKDKKRLDDKRERSEGKMWRKGKGSEAAAMKERRERKKSKAGKAGAKGTKGKGKKLKRR
jgi:ATP-dependent RNA helicase DDX27